MPQHRDLVVVGASAGGVEALRALVAGIPAGLPAAILVVLHLPSGGSSALQGILDRAGALPVSTAVDGQSIVHGTVVVAPPDHHLLVAGDRLSLSAGPTEAGHRPAIDALFRSAAETAGQRVIGVVLSGALDDGARGLLAIRSHGGLTVVQAPADAGYPAMPDSAIEKVGRPDLVLAAPDIGARLAELITEPSEEPGPAEPGQDSGSDVHIEKPDHDHPATAKGTDVRMQGAIRTAVRSLDDRTAMSRHLAAGARQRGSGEIAGRYDRSAEESDDAADVLRDRLGSESATEHDARSDHAS